MKKILYPSDFYAELQVINMGRLKYRVTLTAKETAELERLVRQQTQPQNKVRRAQIILMANRDGLTCQCIRHLQK